MIDSIIQILEKFGLCGTLNVLLLAGLVVMGRQLQKAFKNINELNNNRIADLSRIMELFRREKSKLREIINEQEKEEK